MPAPATHNGHCQVCGALQAVNTANSDLAKHGYTVTNGYFSGTCWGSGHQPYEISKNLIEESIVRAENYVARLNVSIAELLAPVPADADTTWIHEYRRELHTKSFSGYLWKKVQVQVEETVKSGTYANGNEYSHTVRTYRYHRDNGKGGVELTTLNHVYASSLQELVEKHNKVYASHLQAEAKQLGVYIQQQKHRAETWVERPLVPRVKDADKKQTTRTKGARVQFRKQSGGPLLTGVVVGSSSQHGWCVVTIKVDGREGDGSCEHIRQSWLTLLPREEATA